MYFGGFKWVVLANGVGWSGFYVNMDWGRLGWAEMDSLYKTI